MLYKQKCVNGCLPFLIVDQKGKETRMQTWNCINYAICTKKPWKRYLQIYLSLTMCKCVLQCTNKNFIWCFTLRSVILFCVLGESLAEATGDFIVLQSPNCVHFLPDASPIATDEIAPVIAASFGLPFHKVDSRFCYDTLLLLCVHI